MLTTQELVNWAFNAEQAREDSWIEREGAYNLTMTLAARQTRPANANDTEQEIVICWLYTAWNEVQDWHAILCPDEHIEFLAKEVVPEYIAKKK